jgi:hypothetical protein
MAVVTSFHVLRNSGNYYSISILKVMGFGSHQSHTKKGEARNAELLGLNLPIGGTVV